MTTATPPRGPLLFYDGTTILDAETHRSYREICEHGYGNGGAGNGAASQWCDGFALSSLLPGESEPPECQVGQ